MGSYAVRFLDTAENDLLALVAYVARVSPRAAAKLAADIRHAVDSLETMPRKVPIYDWQPIFRKMVVGDVLVFYVVYEEPRRVDVHRVVHGKRRLL